MDSKLSVQSKRSPKQTKTKKKPIKVVYIGNPMRVETSASQFRALVQELTGRHSDSFHLSSPHSDLSKFDDADAADEKLNPLSRSGEDDPSKSVQLTLPLKEQISESSYMFDDAFAFQMWGLENFTSYGPPIF